MHTNEKQYLINEDGFGFGFRFGLWRRLFRTSCLFNIRHCGGKASISSSDTILQFYSLNQMAERQSIPNVGMCLNEHHTQVQIYLFLSVQHRIRLQRSLSDWIERPTRFWFGIQIGCDEVGGEKPQSSVVLTFPPVWIAAKMAWNKNCFAILLRYILLNAV